MALTDNLISYYKLDESSGNASDSVGSNTLTNVNSVVYATAKLNKGADLERSSSQYLSIADGSQSGLDITGNISVSAWIKIESLPTANEINIVVAKEDFSVSGNRAYAFGVEETAGGTTYKLGIRLNGSSYNSNAYAFTTNTWYHITFTRIQSTGAIAWYINGNAEGTSSGITTALNNSPAAFAIGARFNGASPTDFWDGLVDELGIWSRALSADEVSQLYNSNRALAYPLTAPTLYGGVAYWKLDESSGNASDSISSYTLTNNNSASYTSSKINNGVDFGNPNTNKHFSTTSALGIDGGAMSMAGWVRISAQPPTNDNIRFFMQLIATGTFTANMVYYRDSGGTKQLLFNRLRENTANDSFTYNTTLTIGTWYHIAYVYDGSTITGYLNGSSVGTVSSTGNGSSGAGYSTGSWFGSAQGASNFLTGGLDEVGIWNRALSSTEITELYNSGNGKQYPFNVISFIISETLALSETITNLRTRLFTVSETLSLSETKTFLKGVVFTVAESLGLAEIFTSTRTRLFTVSESLGLVEVLARVKKKWNNHTKPTTPWTDRTKPTTDWTNRPKM